MKFKRLSKNNDAVETVIAVILMVAITVILAAAIGATVFSQGPEKPGPQAKLEITPINAYINSSNPAVVKFIHNGGDSINFGNKEITKVTASVNRGDSIELNAVDLQTLEPGTARSLTLDSDNMTNFRTITSGSKVNFKVVDVQSGQLICDRDIQF